MGRVVWLSPSGGWQVLSIYFWVKGFRARVNFLAREAETAAAASGSSTAGTPAVA